MCKVRGMIIIWIEGAIHLIISQPSIQKTGAAGCDHSKGRRQARQ